MNQRTWLDLSGITWKKGAKKECWLESRLDQIERKTDEFNRIKPWNNPHKSNQHGDLAVTLDRAGLVSVFSPLNGSCKRMKIQGKRDRSTGKKKEKDDLLMSNKFH